MCVGDVVRARAELLSSFPFFLVTSQLTEGLFRGEQHNTRLFFRCERENKSE